MGKPILGLVAVGLAACLGACFLGRAGPAASRVHEAAWAREQLERIELPGRPGPELSFRRCVVNQAKYFDEYHCGSTLVRLSITREPLDPTWARLDEWFVLDGWSTGFPSRYTHPDFDGSVSIVLDEDELLRRVKGTEHDATLKQAIASLEPDERMIGVLAHFHTPRDVMSSHTCYLGC